VLVLALDDLLDLMRRVAAREDEPGRIRAHPLVLLARQLDPLGTAGI
jgi:hypothetical protein